MLCVQLVRFIHSLSVLLKLKSRWFGAFCWGRGDILSDAFRDASDNLTPQLYDSKTLVQNTAFLFENNHNNLVTLVEF